MAPIQTPDHTPVGTSLNKYEALTILYLDKQSIRDASPEELVSKFIETHDRIVREFDRQKQLRKRRINPMPL